VRVGRILYILLLVSSAMGWASSLSSFQTRALWVTRWNYRSAADIEQIINNAVTGRFNTILFQVRGNGTVFYPSEIEPWAMELGGQNPGWDPLQTAIRLAHANHIELHAWINVYPGWCGDDPPKQGQQLYHAHPDWFMVDQNGRRQKANDHYSFLSPTHPEVTPYLLRVCQEIIDNYRVDGLHLDYIRFPGPAFSWDEPSVTRFRLQYSCQPENEPALWSGYRRQAIADFIVKLHQLIVQKRPEMKLTASVLGDYHEGYRVYLQDSHEWLARGIIDAIFPMIYTRDNQRFRRELTEHRLNDHRRHVYPGIYIAHAQRLRNQCDIAQELGCQGLSLFSYDLLFPNHVLNEEFRDLLPVQWPEKAVQAPMTWKEQSGDTQGPVVEEVYTLPVKVYQDARFKIAARISDPSGVYDDKTGSNGQGIYLLYDRVWPPNKGKEVRLSRHKTRPGWYITDEALAADNAGLDFRFRIFAWDNNSESAGHPKRNLGFSDIWSLCILAPAETYRSMGPWGPEIWDPSDMALDQNQNLWVVTHVDRQLEIIDRNQLKKSFSPILEGMNNDFRKERLQPIIGLAFCPPNIMCVSSQNSQRIYRFETQYGGAMASIELNYQPGELTCDREGHLYILEQGSSRWHVTTSLGIELQGSPFGIEHSANDIAVLEDGSRIFISDRTTNGVQCWHGAIEGYRARYWQEDDLPAMDVGWAGLARDRSDYVYVPHSQAGAVSIFNRNGKPVEHLVGGTPALNAPQDIAVSTSGDTLFVIETMGSGPTRILQWLKKKI
jgi:uncharacterized lipoprotein YddW (UPF0748 family)